MTVWLDSASEQLWPLSGMVFVHSLLKSDEMMMLTIRYRIVHTMLKHISIMTNTLALRNASRPMHACS